MHSFWLRFKSKIPKSPGVYIYKNKEGEVLYVGKAIDLYSRVSSYFHISHPERALIGQRGVISKQKVLVERIADIQTIPVQSEIEALILEANLIKKYLPPFNVRLTDDKDYLYIALTVEDFPKIISARRKDLEGIKKYWGPFPSSRTVRDTLKSLRRVFPWCSSLHSRSAGSIPPCFYFHLGLCPGPCAGVISKEEYGKIIKRFSKFMDGKKDQLLPVLTTEMKAESDKQHFEQAARVKKMIGGILYLTQTNRTKFYLENPNFLQEENRKALEQLKQDLNLDKLPERIEGYDISNIQGKEATGSMVVLTGGEIDKSQYRKFKIRLTGRPNDVGMHREMLQRRFKHTDWPLPDLIIIDGGRGQAKAAQLKIENCKLKIPVYGLAKRLEWLYPPAGEIIKLPGKSLSLMLLQRLRDEAHRFALSYHRKLRGRMFLGN